MVMVARSRTLLRARRVINQSPGLARRQTSNLNRKHPVTLVEPGHLGPMKWNRRESSHSTTTSMPHPTIQLCSILLSYTKLKKGWMTHREDRFPGKPEEDHIGNQSSKSENGQSETLGPENEGRGRPQGRVQERVLQVSLEWESYGPRWV